MRPGKGKLAFHSARTGTGLRFTSLALGALFSAGLWLTPQTALAAPVDEKIELLRTRPTGMDEREWRSKRREAARELGDVRDKRAVDALIEVAETERYDVLLSIAVEGLGKQGDPRALPALQRIHADRSVDKFVRDQAAEAIRTLGDTPRDDARLVSGEVSSGDSTGNVTTGPQLGAMGAASAPDEALPEPKRRRPLPDNLRARDRSLDLVMGSLDLSVNTAWQQQPVLADAGLGVVARYVDERNQWGWSAKGALTGSLRNGDYRRAPDPDTANDPNDPGDTGNTLYIREQLAGQLEAHYYFGRTDVHLFAALGADQRFTMLRIDDDGDDDSRDEAALRDNRFALDLAPAGGVGWGRNLNAGSEMRVDAIEKLLREENILARDIDAEGKRAIQDAIYLVANDRASYPRLAHTLETLRGRGYLVRAPSPRLVYRLIRAIDDPSYVQRPKGPLVRAGFVYAIPIKQGDYLLRSQDSAVAGPMLQFDYGIQIDLEREILVDTRILYDALGGVTGISTDSGASYRRYLHGRWNDYVGEWHVALRGGVSKRNWQLPDGAPPEGIGYRIMAGAGYAYAFNRGSRIDVGVTGGLESGAVLVGAGIGLRFGIGRGTIHTSAPKKKSAAPGETKSTGSGESAAGSESATSSGAAEGSTP
jgi:hypothetical protein